jgi:hypothetical protein
VMDHLENMIDESAHFHAGEVEAWLKICQGS